MSSKKLLAGNGFVASVIERKPSAYEIRGAGSLGEIAKKGVTNGSVVLISSVNVTDKDIALPVVGLDSYRTLFKFGKDFGSLTINFTVYIGPSDGGASEDPVKDIREGFEEVRISNADKPIMVSVAADKKAYLCYPNSMEIGEVDADKNSVRITIACILAPST